MLLPIGIRGHAHHLSSPASSKGTASAALVISGKSVCSIACKGRPLTVSVNNFSTSSRLLPEDHRTGTSTISGWDEPLPSQTPKERGPSHREHSILPPEIRYPRPTCTTVYAARPTRARSG